MKSKKLDKSQLPQPQKFMGRKSHQLQISSSKANNLTEQQILHQQQATIKNSSGRRNSIYEKQEQNECFHNSSGNNRKLYQNSSNNRKSIESTNNNNSSKLPITQSQHSLEQKQLLTFAAGRSNQDQQQSIYNRKEYLMDSQAGDLDGQHKMLSEDKKNKQLSKNAMNNSNTRQTPIKSRQSSNQNRSSSKNKQHKSIIYKHFLPPPFQQQFISYSIVTKQSNTGMFSNQKILVLNSQLRQLMYYSKLPKTLPYDSYQQMQEKYLQIQQPKEIIQLDKVKRFMFVPGKSHIGQVVVSYLTSTNERRQWKVSVGNNKVMNEWIQIVNQVVKRQHYAQAKSQIKYPPRPKKQSQAKHNNYETSFTKILKKQVLPLIQQSKINQSQKQAQDSQSLKGSGSKMNKVLRQPPSPQRQKQYYMDKSKFMNTKTYVIDLQDARSEDVFYQPPISKKNIQQVQLQKQQQNNGEDHLATLQFDKYPDSGSKFSYQLQKKQRQVADQHKNRISAQINKSQVKQSGKINEFFTATSTKSLNRKSSLTSSNERLSQTTHKDLNVHIDTEKLMMNEYKQNQHDNEEGQYHGQYENLQRQIPSNMAKKLTQSYMSNQKDYQPLEGSRKRGQTQLILGSKQKQNRPNSQKPNPNTQKYAAATQNNEKHRYSQNNNSNNPVPPQNRQHSTFNRRVSQFNATEVPSSAFSQIQDIITGNKGNFLHQAYILNFYPQSTNNNWFRLWIQAQGPANKVHIYTAFMKSCQKIAKRIIDNPQPFVNCSYMLQNNTHVVFKLQNLTFKIPFKLAMPQGLGQFISLVDFMRSQEFLTNLFKYQSQMQNEFNNYAFILAQLSEQFNDHLSSLPIYLPMCCLVKYRGVTVLCKPSIQDSNLRFQKVPQTHHKLYENQLSYIQQKCHVGFNISSQHSSFDLYQINLPSSLRNKAIIYMQNLRQYLPMMANPLVKNKIRNLQLNQRYITNYVKSGIIDCMQIKNQEQIERHFIKSVVKKVADAVKQKGDKIVSECELMQIVEGQGFRKEYLGEVYNINLNNSYGMSKDTTSGKQDIPSQLSSSFNSVILTEIVLNQYLKVCKLHFMKQFARKLVISLSSPSNSPLSYQQTKNNNQNTPSSTLKSYNSKTIKNLQSNHLSHNIKSQQNEQFGCVNDFRKDVMQMLDYLLCKNTKVWNVLGTVLQQKYSFDEFKLSSNDGKSSNNRARVQKLIKRIDMNYLIVNFLNKLGVQGQVVQWDESRTTWQNFELSQSSFKVTQRVRMSGFPLSLFHPEYATLLSQLQQISSSENTPPTPNITSSILQVLNIQQEFYNNQSYLVKSHQYQLLEMTSHYQRQLVDLVLGYGLPVNNETCGRSSTRKHSKIKIRHIDLYSNLFYTQKSMKTSSYITSSNYNLAFIGIKWLIKQTHYDFASILIKQLLLSLQIWTSVKSVGLRSKLYDLYALFSHKKLANKNNTALEYSLKSLELSLNNDHNPKNQIYKQSAEKAFQAANIHFECGQLQKSLQLYQLTQKLVYKEERNRTENQQNEYQQRNRTGTQHNGADKLCIQFVKIYLKKAQIKMALGKIKQTLQQCLQCLKKCEQFEDMQVLQQNQHDFEAKQAIQLAVFEIMFRCYQITKNQTGIKRIAQLACGKFVQDRILLFRSIRGFNLQANNRQNVIIRHQLMTRVVKMCWISLIAQLSTNQDAPRANISEKPLQNQFPFLKSFCLNGVLSHKRKLSLKQINGHSHHLRQLKQKLQALHRLYPNNRYSQQTLTSFLCQQTIQQSNAVGSKDQRQKIYGTKHQYSTIGDHRIQQGKALRIQALIIGNSNNNSQNGLFQLQSQMTSVLYDRFDEVLKWLSGEKSKTIHASSTKIFALGNNQRQRNKDICLSPQRRKITRERFKTQSANFSYSQNRHNSRSCQRRTSQKRPELYPPRMSVNQLARHQDFSQIKTKKRPNFDKYNHSQFQSYPSSSSILPFALEHQQHQNQRQLQPQLRNPNHQIRNYTIYSLKDQTDTKYMLIQVIFGLCGREFVFGCLDEAIQREKVRQSSQYLESQQHCYKTTIFYD